MLTYYKLVAVIKKNYPNQLSMGKPKFQSTTQKLCPHKLVAEIAVFNAESKLNDEMSISINE